MPTDATYQDATVKDCHPPQDHLHPHQDYLHPHWENLLPLIQDPDQLESSSDNKLVLYSGRLRTVCIIIVIYLATAVVCLSFPFLLGALRLVSDAGEVCRWLLASEGWRVAEAP